MAARDLATPPRDRRKGSVSWGRTEQLAYTRNLSEHTRDLEQQHQRGTDSRARGATVSGGAVASTIVPETD